MSYESGNDKPRAIRVEPGRAVEIKSPNGKVLLRIETTACGRNFWSMQFKQSRAVDFQFEGYIRGK